MAKQPQKKQTLDLKLDQPQRKSRLPLFLAIAGAVLGFILLLSVIHMSGWVDGPEEALYQKTAKGGIMQKLLTPLHHPDFKSSMTTNEVLDVTVLQGEMRKAATIIQDQKDQIDSLRKKVSKLEKNSDKLAKMEKDVKTLKETGVEVTPEAIMAAMQGAPAPAASRSAAAPAALPALPGPQGQSLLSAFQARDYRKVTKIVAAMPQDQAADVLDVLSMQDENFVIEVLAALKEDEAAGILQNFEPGKTGDLLQKIAARRTSGT